jgi:hypothetical protein
MLMRLESAFAPKRIPGSLFARSIMGEITQMGLGKPGALMSPQA